MRLPFRAAFRPSSPFRGLARSLPAWANQAERLVNIPDGAYLSMTDAVYPSDPTTFTFVARFAVTNPANADSRHILGLQYGADAYTVRWQLAASGAISITLTNTATALIATFTWNAKILPKHGIVTMTVAGSAAEGVFVTIGDLLLPAQAYGGGGSGLRMTAVQSTRMALIHTLDSKGDIAYDRILMYPAFYDPRIEEQRRLLFGADGRIVAAPPAGAWLDVRGQSVTGILTNHGSAGGTFSPNGTPLNYAWVSPGTDGSPDTITFAQQDDVATGATVTFPAAGSVVLSGVARLVPISVVNGTYSINGGAYTSSPGFIWEGQQINVRHTAAAGGGQFVTTTLTVGDRQFTAVSRTAGAGWIVCGAPASLAVAAQAPALNRLAFGASLASMGLAGLQATPVLGNPSWFGVIAAEGDDGFDMISLSLWSPDPYCRVGDDQLISGGEAASMWRFTGVAVPNGATIVNAQLEVTVTTEDGSGAAWRLRGHDVDSESAFSNSNRSAVWESGAAVTDAFYDYVQSGTGAKVYDCTDIIQEIVNRGGWSSGNNIGLYMRATSDPTGSGNRTEFADRPTSGYAGLRIEYTA